MVETRALTMAVIFGVFLVALISVTFIPAMFDAEQSRATALDEYEEAERNTLTDGLRIELLAVTDQGNASVEVFDRIDRNSQTQEIPQGESHTFEFDRGNISVTADNVFDTSAELFIEYPATFGFSDRERLLSQTVPGFVALLTLFIYLGFIVGVFLE